MKLLITALACMISVSVIGQCRETNNSISDYTFELSIAEFSDSTLMNNIPNKSEELRADFIKRRKRAFAIMGIEVGLLAGGVLLVHGIKNSNSGSASGSDPWVGADIDITGFVTRIVAVIACVGVIIGTLVSSLVKNKRDYKKGMELLSTVSS